MECREFGKMGHSAYGCYSNNKVNPDGHKKGNYGAS